MTLFGVSTTATFSCFEKKRTGILNQSIFAFHQLVDLKPTKISVDLRMFFFTIKKFAYRLYNMPPFLSNKVDYCDQTQIRGNETIRL